MAAVERTLVIGVGNVDGGDDGVGCVIARRIRSRSLPGVKVVEQNGDGLLLTEAWSRFDDVIVIDAVRSGSNPGTIHRLNARRESLPTARFYGSTHALGLAEAIELSRAMGKLPSRLLIFGVEGKNFEIGAELSTEVTGVIEEVADRVAQDIRQSEGDHARDVVNGRPASKDR